VGTPVPLERSGYDPGSSEPALQLVSVKVRTSADPTPLCTVSVVGLLRHQDL